MTEPPQSGLPNRLLVVTNDFPPRAGGIQSFVHAVVDRLPADRVVVLTSRWRGWQEWDAAAAYPVVRHDTSVLLPTPAVRRRAVELVEAHGCDAVWFGAAAPLGLLADPLRAAGARTVVATTHGHEVGWAMTPPGRVALRRIAAGSDTVTYLGEFTRSRLTTALGRYADRLVPLTPGVDADVFTPDAAAAGVRRRLGLADRPVVVCVSRLTPRKGQDALVRALPAIRREAPGAALLLVGGGPARSGLVRLAAECGVTDDVLMTGSVPHDDLPAWYAAGDVFAMPCRSRLGGADVEGLGMVFLEAQACGLPVVVGDSGGAPDTVRDGETGVLVDGRDVGGVAAAVGSLLADPDRAAAMGAAGRQWVEQRWSWDRTMDDFRQLIAPAETGPRS